MSLLACALVSVLCAVYGIWKFNSDYTCLVVKWNKTLKRWCNWGLALPSACLACLVLIIAVYKAFIVTGGGIGGYFPPQYSPDYAQ